MMPLRPLRASLIAFIALGALSGAQAEAGALSSVLAGSGPGFPSSGSFAGDNGPATKARLKAPAQAAIEDKGSLLVVDASNRRIRRIENGKITTVAGSGRRGDCGDRVPAQRLCLGVPHGVLADGKGGFWIADTFNSKIRYVSKSGQANTVLGGSCKAESWACAQEGHVNDVRLALPIAIKPGPNGSKIITDAGTHRILLWRKNWVKIIAGSGRPTFSGDGGPARAAALLEPQDAVAYRGGYLIADGGNCRLRHVGRDGLIQTIAGEGISPANCRQYIESWLPGPVVEDGPALSAQIAVVSSVAVRGDTIYISDFLGGRIREIKDGQIKTTAGQGGSPRHEPNSIPGRIVPQTTDIGSEPLVYPSGISICKNGNLIVADPGNSRVWQIGGTGRCR